MKPANFAPVYCAIYPELAEIARKHGYALSVHGSLGRDFDLVCIPWGDNPASPTDVIADMCKEFAIRPVGSLVIKPHGRLCQTMSIAHGECSLDLSFIMPYYTRFVATSVRNGNQCIKMMDEYDLDTARTKLQEWHGDHTPVTLSVTNGGGNFTLWKSEDA